MENTSPITALPPVGRIEGLRYLPSESTDTSKGQVEVQYTDPAGSWFVAKMPVLDALYLLNLLEELSRQARLDHLRRPPGTGQ